MPRKIGACHLHGEEIRQWVAEELTLQEIAQRIGTTRHRVAEYIAKQGIPRVPVARVGARNGRWTGGRIIDQDGYVLIKSHGHPYADRHNYVREHRLVMEKKLGRYLQPQEVVHHKDKDGSKENNDPDNLEVFGTNAEHLAETLQGHRPNWTPDGWDRMNAPKPRRKVPKPPSTLEK